MFKFVPKSLPPSALGLHIVYYFARVAITQDHKFGGINKRNALSHSSGGEKSEIKVLACLVSFEADERRIYSRHLSSTWR